MLFNCLIRAKPVLVMAVLRALRRSATGSMEAANSPTSDGGSLARLTRPF